MRKFLKSKVLIAMLLLTALFAVGCGSSDDSSSDDSYTTSQTEDQSSDESGDVSDTLKALREKGVLTVGSSNDAPFAYVDVETGEFSGIDAEIIKEVASRLGIDNVEMKEISFENLIVELNNGSIDMVTDAMYIKEERLEQALFTNVWYQEGEGIIVPTDSDITSKEDLETATIGAQKGTAFLETAQAWSEEGKVGEVTVFSKQTELMMAVNTGKIDCCITDGIVAAYTLSQDSSLDLKLLSPYESEATGQIGAAIRFEDKEFLNEVNAVLDEMKEDGTLMQILTDFGLSEDYFVGVEDGQTENVK